MRRFLTVILATLALSCGTTIGFEVPIDVPETTVEGSTLGAIGEFLPDFMPPLSIDLSEERAFQRQNVEQVDSVVLSALHLSLTDKSAQQNFDFLDSISVEAVDESGERTVVVATLDPVPDGARRLDLAPTRKELVDVLGTDFTIRFQVRGSPPARDAVFDGRATFQVEAEVL